MKEEEFKALIEKFEEAETAFKELLKPIEEAMKRLKEQIKPFEDAAKELKEQNTAFKAAIYTVMAKDFWQKSLKNRIQHLKKQKN